MTAILTVPQLGVVAYAAGFRGDALVMAVAVAIRESSGNPAVVADIDNPAPGCRSVGLMQINLCPKYDNRVWYRANPERLFDPVDNMRAAFEMSLGGANWRPWTTRARAAADMPRIRSALPPEADLAAGQIPATGAAPTPPTGGAGSGPGVFGAVTDTLAAATRWETWRRVLQFTAGAALVVFGFSLIAGEQTAGFAQLAGLPDPTPDSLGEALTGDPDKKEER